MAIGFEQFLDILFEITSRADNIKDIRDTGKCSKQFVRAYLSDCCSIHERIKSVVWQCYTNHKTAIPSTAVVSATIAEIGNSVQPVLQYGHFLQPKLFGNVLFATIQL